MIWTERKNRWISDVETGISDYKKYNLNLDTIP